MKRAILAAVMTIAMFGMSAASCDPTVNLAPILPAAENPPVVTVAPTCPTRGEMRTRTSECIRADLRLQAPDIFLGNLDVNRG